MSELEIIYEVLAELFDHPCNLSSPEEEVHKTEASIEWCEKHCGKATAAECWEHYFQLKFAERRKG